MWTRGLIATLTRFSAIYSPGMLPSPPLMGTAFVGYSFEFVFEGLGHKFRFILPLTEYPPLYQLRTLTARMCFTQHITAYLFFATTFRLYFVAAN